MLTDRRLAESVYAHFGIPVEDWDAHYQVDTTAHGLLWQARQCYLAILRTL